jgi:hypothetical protein
MKYLLLLFINTICFSQNINFYGTVQNNDRSIENASVIVFDSNQNILGYSYTDQKGYYSIKLQNIESQYLYITVSCLGYKKNEIKVFTNNLTAIEKSFELEEKVENLNEVVLKTEQKIKIDNDTITIKTKYFTNDTEQTVEDVLKRIPGIEVLEDGSIKAGGKVISKLLIEGDDLFDQDYKLLSKNLDGKVLDAVQILKNFEDNPILKQLGDSDAVAINLKLKKDKLNIWFGNVTLGCGVVSENRWKESLNLGLIRKKIKLLNLADYNNSGTKANSQISKSFSFGNMYRQDRYEKETRSIFNSHSGENTTFSNTQSIFNEAFFNTLAFNTKLKTNLSLRSVSYFAFDKQTQNSFDSSEYLVEPVPISLTESKNYNLKNKNFGSEIELKYHSNPKNYFTANIIYKNNPKRIHDNVLFNNDLINTSSKNNNYSLYNHFYHTFKMGRNKVINNYFYFGADHLTEKNNVISPFLNNFFSADANALIKEEVTNSITYVGFKSKLISKYKKIENVTSIKLESTREKNANTFLVANTFNPNYTNSISLKQNILGLENGLKLEITKDLELDSRITCDITNYNTGIFSKTYTLLNTSNSLNYDLKKIGIFSASHTLNNSLPAISLLINNYQLVNYRSFSKGIVTTEIPIIKSNTFSLAHNYFGTANRFSTSTNLSYTKSQKASTLETTITNNFIFNNASFVKGGDRYRFDFKLINFIRKLKIATKLETQQTWINSPINLNANTFSNINTLFSTYVFSGTTYLEKPYNFDFTVTQNRSYTNFNDTKTTNVITKANASVNYKFSEILITELKSDFYWLDQTYSFLNTNLIYTPKNSRFSYQMVVNNLFNVSEFKITSLNQFTKVTSSIPLIERYILLTVKYRL